MEGGGPPDDVRGHLLLRHEVAVEARRAAAGEGLGEHGEGGVVGVGHPRALVPDGDLVGGRGVAEVDHALLGLLGLGGEGHGGDLRGLQVAVVLHEEGEEAGVVDVADEDEGGVVGRVPGAVEGAAVLGGEVEDVVHPPDGGVVVGVDAEGVGPELLGDGPLDVVLDAVAALVGDHLLLARDGLLAEHEVVHPLGLQAHHEGELVGRDVLVVVGPVVPGGGVGLGAGALEELVEAARGEVLRLVEHQVFEEVGDARLALPLVPRPHAEPRVVRHHGGARVDHDQHPQPVAEGEPLDHAAAEGEGALVGEALLPERALVDPREGGREGELRRRLHPGGRRGPRSCPTRRRRWGSSRSPRGPSARAPRRGAGG